MTTLTMWAFGPQTMRNAIEGEISFFNKDFPDISVSVHLIPWHKAWDTIVVAANEKQGPDILEVGSTWNGTLAYLGVLRDLTSEFSEAHINKDIFVPAAWKSCNFPGSKKISSIPWIIDIRALYYRKDIFSEIGLNNNVFNTWGSFEKACARIQENVKARSNLGVLGVPGHKAPLLLQNIAPWIWSAGGDFITPDGKHAAFTTEKAIEGIEFYIGLIGRGYIPSYSLKLDDHEITRQFFSEGKYVMSIPGSLNQYSLQVLHAESEVSQYCMSGLFPKGPDGRFAFCGGSNLAVTNFSKKPQEAWELIRFLTCRQSQNFYPYKVNKFPGLIASFEEFFRSKGEAWQGLRDSWKYGRAFPNIHTWGAVEALLVETFSRIFEYAREGIFNMAQIRDLLDEVVSDVDDLLER
ncbi:MAG: extracellular solute-binding protein [bacterium]